MERKIAVSFPGGLRVDAAIDGRIIPTDQSIKEGGAGAAPEPFLLFLASIATCAGIYALRFCETRRIPTDGMALNMACEYDEEAKRYRRMTLDLKLPKGFPKKYEGAIVKAMDLCAVKRQVMNPPEFELSTH